jgi:hypothetical protein
MRTTARDGRTFVLLQILSQDEALHAEQFREPL